MKDFSISSAARTCLAAFACLGGGCQSSRPAASDGMLGTSIMAGAPQPVAGLAASAPQAALPAPAERTPVPVPPTAAMDAMTRAPVPMAGAAAPAAGASGAPVSANATASDAPDAGAASGAAGEPPFVPFPTVMDYGQPGPFMTMTETNVGPANAFTLVRPRELGRGGVLHPVLTWGNGTGANPTSYAALLVHLASHGFIVIASNSPNVGDGVEMRKGVDWVLAENQNTQSALFGKVHPTRIGATGHSQGGSASCAATDHDLVNVGASIQGARFCLMYPPAETKTMLFFAGGADTIVPASQVKSGYDVCTGPTIYAEFAGVDHFNPVPDGGAFRGPLTAWFRFHLMGEAPAGKMFYGDDCTLCMDRAWRVEHKNL